MEQKFCQSCGMPIDDSTFGKETDGSKNEDYCHYCYADGHFTKECTMDEMIELNLNYLDEFNKDSEVKYTVEEARKTMTPIQMSLSIIPDHMKLHQRRIGLKLWIRLEKCLVKTL